MPPGRRSSVCAKYCSNDSPRKKLRPSNSATLAGDGAAIMSRKYGTSARSAQAGNAVDRILAVAMAGLKCEAAQPQRVGDDRYGAQRHRQRGNDGAEKQAEGRIQHARGNRDADRVVGEREYQILADVA